MKKWVDDDVVILKEMLLTGHTYKDIGKKLNRSNRSVKEKCINLGMTYIQIQKLIKTSYEKSICLGCDIEFEDYINNDRKFCSKSCSISYNNKKRNLDYTTTKSAKCGDCDCDIEINLRASVNNCLCAECKANNRKEYDKIINTNLKTEKRKPKSKKRKPKSDQPTKLPIVRICKKCNINTLKARKKYCDTCKYDYYHIYRPRCEFKFSLDEYPDGFNFDLITEHGWYSPTNKKNNLTGVSRDHIYSVKNGYENKIDPLIISHPANCKLMLHNENNSKNTNSNITIEELLNKISEWDKKYLK